jgi:hypothetical protein
MKCAALFASALLLPAAMLAQLPAATTVVTVHVECVPTSPSAAYITITVDPWTAVAYSKSKDEFDWVLDPATDANVSMTIVPKNTKAWPYNDLGGASGGFKKKHHTGKMNTSPSKGSHPYNVHVDCVIGPTKVSGDLDPDVTIDPTGPLVILNKSSLKKVPK